MTNEDLLLDTAGVADLLHVPEATVKSWRHKGGGPNWVRLGRHVRYRLVDVRSWLADRSVNHRG